MILFFFTLSFLFSEHGFDEVAIPNPSAKLKMINHPLNFTNNELMEVP